MARCKGLTAGMAHDMRSQLLTLCDAYGAHRGLTHWRVSFLARGNGQFFKGLRDGGDCTLRTAETVLQWFSDHWPADLPWPSDVPRPKPARPAKGARAEARG